MNRLAVVALLLLLPIVARGADGPLQISGVYPHLAAFNTSGECGIGAVVPWAGKLWYVTYPPHFRTGSTDKLYELDEQMRLTIRPESVGGTHANRMIHKESNQLIIGPYFIDAQGKVRAVDVKKMVGRMTATARHLSDPANKVYFVDMEGPIWEVDVKTLSATRLFVKPIPGWHGKGAYTGQGVLVVANNGEVRTPDLDKLPWELPFEKWEKGPEDAGVLAEWNGKDAAGWKVISRRQHTEVTGPGGISGETNASDPIWSTGWDKRSILLHVRDAVGAAWRTYRLPKASHTYDPKHGWYTEWPRIREIVPAQGNTPARLMMTMHGMMYDFPPTFDPGHTAGIRPIASYLRYVPDFCHWNGRVVLASDDTSIMQNPLAGVSQSNLWFGTPEQLADFGPAAGWGGVWLNDAVKANEPSDPYLFAGFAQRTLHVIADRDVTFRLEVDKGQGERIWVYAGQIRVPAGGGYRSNVFTENGGEWIRLIPDKDCTATAYFHYLTPSKYPAGRPDKMFAAIVPIAGAKQSSAGILRPGQDKLLHYVAREADGKESYYQIDEKLNFSRVDDAGKVGGIHKANDVQADVVVDAASVVVTTRTGKFRLPKSIGDDFDNAVGVLRGVREVESERFLANVHGTFYETPRGEGTVPDWRNAKPIASHGLAIADFCTWRGLLVMSGTASDAQPDGHYFKAADGKHGLWFGQVDDLWRLGKPTGKGGPWRETVVEAGKPSDPYLMVNYDKKSVEFSHDGTEPVTFSIEVDPTNTGQWVRYQAVTADSGKAATYTFPSGFNAYWVRVIADKACRATATFIYE